MAIKKQFSKSKAECKVTLSLPVEAASEAKSVTVVGDFNNWDKASHPMKKFKTGEFKTSLSLETGKEYHFRYLIDGEKYENDWAADKYVPNPESGEDNSVIVL
jgi:1,4-alpha-glucan branching enzyme